MINKVISMLILIIYLFTISPIIDHLFPPLNEEKDDSILLGEVFMHIMVVLIFLYFTNTYLLKILNRYIKTDGKLFELSKPVIISIIIIGLQTHLSTKLKYLTHKHPFRFLNIYKD